jgi:DnaJ family protein C protein 19
MLRLVLFAALACAACRYLTGRWPWDFLRPVPTRAQAVFNARKLLAVELGASRTEIVEAHRRLIAMVHPDKGGSNDQVHQANAARDLLLDELPDEGHLPR